LAAKDNCADKIREQVEQVCMQENRGHESPSFILVSQFLGIPVPQKCQSGRFSSQQRSVVYATIRQLKGEHCSYDPADDEYHRAKAESRAKHNMEASEKVFVSCQILKNVSIGLTGFPIEWKPPALG